MRTFIDQLGSKISTAHLPKRIISLVPSQTELLDYLGLDNRVVGITKFCAHPPSWRSKKSVIGGTKNFNLETIKSLQPDLIIGNKEENYQEGIEQLKSICQVWMSDVTTLSDAFTMIEQVGQITDTSARAESLLDELKISFLTIKKFPPLRTLYLIWNNPWMAVGANTFIHEMITLSGLQNSLENDDRYPEITESKMKELNPELVLLPSEPYPFRQKHISEIKTVLPQAKIVQVDGELFSWYGNRMLRFPKYLNSLREFLH